MSDTTGRHMNYESADFSDRYAIYMKNAQAKYKEKGVALIHQITNGGMDIWVETKPSVKGAIRKAHSTLPWRVVTDIDAKRAEADRIIEAAVSSLYAR